MLLSSCSEPGIGDPETQVLASLEHLPGGRPVQRSTCGVGRSRPPRVGPDPRDVFALRLIVNAAGVGAPVFGLMASEVGLGS